MTFGEVRALIRAAGFGSLATTEAGAPRVRPVMPLCTDDGVLLVALLGRSRTIPQVQRDPRVEICFVDGLRYCRVTGRGYIADDRTKKRLLYAELPILKRYYTSADDPDFVLLEIRPESAESFSSDEPLPSPVAWR
jgi:uncharacterized pyridoxamine 5'-phosphate oxidase family protein